MSLTDEFSLTGSVLLKNLKESAYASLIIVMYSSPNCSTMVSPIPVAWRSEWLFYNQSVSTKRIFIYHYKSQTFQENIWQHMIFFLDHGWNCQCIVVCLIADISLNWKWLINQKFKSLSGPNCFVISKNPTEILSDMNHIGGLQYQSRWRLDMPAITVSLGTKYACILSNDRDHAAYLVSR